MSPTIMTPVAIPINTTLLSENIKKQQHQSECNRRHHRHHRANSTTTSGLLRSSSWQDNAFEGYPVVDDQNGCSHDRSGRKASYDLFNPSLLDDSPTPSTPQLIPPTFQKKQQQQNRRTAVEVRYGAAAAAAAASSCEDSRVPSHIRETPLTRTQSTLTVMAAKAPAVPRSPSRYSALNNTYTPQLNFSILLFLASSFLDTTSPSSSLLPPDNNSDQDDHHSSQQQQSLSPYLPTPSLSSTRIKSAFLQKLGFAPSSIIPSPHSPSSSPSYSEPLVLVPTKSVATRLADRIRTKFQRGPAVPPTSDVISRSSFQSSLASPFTRLRSSTSIHKTQIKPEASIKVDKKKKRRSAPTARPSDTSDTPTNEPITRNTSASAASITVVATDTASTRSTIAHDHHHQQQRKKATVSADVDEPLLTAVATPPLTPDTKKNPTAVVRFSTTVDFQETYSQKDYDRGSDVDTTFSRLTPDLAQFIQEELNHFKLHQMAVHEASRKNTHFYL